jgi:hypothetical protein
MLRCVVVSLVVLALASGCSKGLEICGVCCSNSDCESGACGTFPDGKRLCANKVQGLRTSCCVRLGATSESCQFYSYSETDVTTHDRMCYAPPEPFSDCTWKAPAGTTVAGPPPTSNNAADLSGATVGRTAVDPALRRTVPAALSPAVPDLEVGDAFLLKQSATSETFFIVLPLRNTGSSLICGIAAMSLSTLNAAGSVTADNSYPAFNGSVGVAGARATNGCLAPGETGYFNSVDTSVTTATFADTASLRLGLKATTPGTAVTATLIPNRFEMGSCAGMSDVLRVQATAAGGDVSVAVGAGGMISGLLLFLDADGLPVGAWDHVTTKKSLQIAAGETASFYADLSSSAPKVSRVLVFTPIFSQVSSAAP